MPDTRFGKMFGEERGYFREESGDCLFHAGSGVGSAAEDIGLDLEEGIRVGAKEPGPDTSLMVRSIPLRGAALIDRPEEF